MSKLLTLLVLFCLTGLSTAASAASMPLIASPVAHTPAALPNVEFGALPLPGVELSTASAKTNRKFASMTRAEKRAVRKDFRQNLKQLRKSLRGQNKAAVSDDNLLLIIITILLAPLGMFLYEGEANKRVLISFLLWLLLFVPGIIYTLYIILQGK